MVDLLDGGDRTVRLEGATAGDTDEATRVEFLEIVASSTLIVETSERPSGASERSDNAFASGRRGRLRADWFEDHALPQTRRTSPLADHLTYRVRPPSIVNS